MFPEIRLVNLNSCIFTRFNGPWMFPYLNPRQSPFWIFLGTAIRRRARLIGLFDGRNNNPENPEIGSKCQKYFSFFFYNIFEDSSFEKWVSRWTKTLKLKLFFLKVFFLFLSGCCPFEALKTLSWRVPWTSAQMNTLLFIAPFWLICFSREERFLSRFPAICFNSHFYPE